jgi:hypothetical protein
MPSSAERNDVESIMNQIAALLQKPEQGSKARTYQKVSDKRKVLVNPKYGIAIS